MVLAKTAVPSGRAFWPWLHLSSGLKASMAFNQVRNPATPYTISADIGGALLDFRRKSVWLVSSSVSQTPGVTTISAVSYTHLTLPTNREV